MKTAIEIAENEIAELWSSPSDQPTYSQIFGVLERVKPIFEQQIIDAYETKIKTYINEDGNLDIKSGELFYKETFETKKL